MKKPVLIEESEARSMWQNATPEFKKLLETTFGKEFFSMKITDRIKTYEDACKELGIEPLDESEMIEAGFTPDEIIYRMIKTITKALVGDWKTNWEDGSQKKWYPWFKVSSGGFVFYVAPYRYSGADAGSASRLCFPTEELAIYAGKQFIELYKKFIL